MQSTRPTRNFFQFFSHLKSIGFAPGTIIDIGAAHGTPDLLNAFPGSYFVLFEPMKEFEPDLKSVLKKVNGEYHLCALLDKKEKIEISKPKDLYSTSLIGDKKDERLGIVNDNVIIQSDTLDNILHNKKLSEPFLIKTDCQGGDLNALKGSVKTLAKCEVVIVEVSFFKFRGDSHPTLLDIVSFMENRGFVPYDLLDGLYRPLDHALGQIDIAFVKKDSRFRMIHEWATENSKPISYISSDDAYINEVREILTAKSKRISELEWIVNDLKKKLSDHREKSGGIIVARLQLKHKIFDILQVIKRKLGKKK
jgi:FkbM family methyltransferase